MTYSQKYTLVAFLVPVALDDTYSMSDWPLHITIADVFSATRNSQLHEQLEQLFCSQEVFTISIGDEAILGSKKVALVVKDNELATLHNRTIELLNQHGAIFNNPEYMKSGYVPHVSLDSPSRLNKTQQKVVSCISLVDMFPNGDWKQRKVIQNYMLAVKHQ